MDRKAVTLVLATSAFWIIAHVFVMNRAETGCIQVADEQQPMEKTLPADEIERLTNELRNAEQLQQSMAETLTRCQSDLLEQRQPPPDK